MGAPKTTTPDGRSMPSPVSRIRATALPAAVGDALAGADGEGLGVGDVDAEGEGDTDGDGEVVRADVLGASPEHADTVARISRRASEPGRRMARR
jgi:hypothetical protein